MSLTLRPTKIKRAPINTDLQDWDVYCGEWRIGRIYEERGGPPELKWFWSIFPSTDLPPGVHRQGKALSLEEAKREFGVSWAAWKAWAKLTEIED
jgi:hypothetical protein